MRHNQKIESLISPELIIIIRRWVYAAAFLLFLITNWGHSFTAGRTLLNYIFLQLAGESELELAFGSLTQVDALAKSCTHFLMFFAFAFLVDRMLERLSFNICDINWMNSRFEKLETERLKILKDKTNLMEYERRLCDYSDGLTLQFELMKTQMEKLIKLSMNGAERKAAKKKPKNTPSETGNIFDFQQRPKTKDPEPKAPKALNWQKPKLPKF